MRKTPLLGFARSPIIGGGHLALRFAGRIRRRVRHFHFAVRQADGFHRHIVSSATAGGVIGGNNDILELVLHVLDGLVAGRATQRHLDLGERLPVGRMQHDFGRVVTHLRLQYKCLVLTLRDGQAAPPAATRGDRLRHAVTEGEDLDLLLKACNAAVTVDTLHLTKDIGWHVLSPDDWRLRVHKKRTLMTASPHLNIPPSRQCAMHHLPVAVRRSQLAEACHAFRTIQVAHALRMAERDVLGVKIPAEGRFILCERSQRICDLYCSSYAVQLGYIPRVPPFFGQNTCKVANAVTTTLRSVLMGSASVDLSPLAGSTVRGRETWWPL